MRTFPKKNILYCLLLFLLVPFTFSQVFAGDYLSSSHGGDNGNIAGVDRSSINTIFTGYSSGSCAHCHLQHASVTDSSTNESYTAQPYLLSNINNLTGFQFCTECHDSNGPASDDIASYYGQAIGHGQPGNEVNCTECHNPHAARSPHAEAVDGNDATTGSIIGANGVEPVSWPNPTPAPDSEPSETLLAPSAYTVVDPITIEYQLCFKCHSNYNGGPVGTLSNQAAQFNPNNYAHHPVTGTGQWRNQNIRSNFTTSLKSPWNANLDARMHCSDCHYRSNSATPTPLPGPHGSNIQYMLRAWGGVDSRGNLTANAANSYDALCLLCHIDGYATGSVSGSPWSHGSNSAHQYEGDAGGDNSLGCRACHGGPETANFTADSSYTATTNGGTRNALLHGQKFYWSNPTGYTNNPADHFLMGGYLTGIYLDNYDGGNDGDGVCWAAGSANREAPCGSMVGGKGW